MGVLDGVHVPQSEEEVSGFFAPTGLNGIVFKQKCIRLVHGKLTIFPYGQCIVRNVRSLAF